MRKWWVLSFYFLFNRLHNVSVDNACLKGLVKVDMNLFFERHATVMMILRWKICFASIAINNGQIMNERFNLTLQLFHFLLVFFTLRRSRNINTM